MDKQQLRAELENALLRLQLECETTSEQLQTIANLEHAARADMATLRTMQYALDDTKHENGLLKSEVDRLKLALDKKPDKPPRGLWHL